MTKRKGISIQSQYLLFTGVLGVLIVISIYFSYLDIGSQYRLLKTNTQQTFDMRKMTLEIRGHIDALISGIDVVMLEPEYKAQVDLIYDASFTELNQIIAKLSNSGSSGGVDLTEDLDELSLALDELYHVAKRLFEIRVSANLQYPSMEISSREMQPARDQVFNILDTAIREHREEGRSKDAAIYYELLIAAKQTWSNLIGEYRLYLANRVGSFDETNLFTQEHIIEGYIDQMLETAANIMAQQAHFGFEGEQ